MLKDSDSINNLSLAPTETADQRSAELQVLKDKKLKESSSQRIKAHLQAHMPRTSEVASIDTIFPEADTVSQLRFNQQLISSPTKAADQRSAELRELRDKKFKESSSQGIEAHLQAHMPRTSEVAQTNVINPA